MPQTQSAVLNRSEVPTREVLHNALKELKFKLSVDDSYCPFESAGYLPCTINGEDGGLDIRFAALEPYLAQYPNLQAQAGQRDTLITLRSGGDPREEVCVLMLAAVLAEKFGAVVHDPKRDALIPADKLINQARNPGLFNALKFMQS